MESERSKAIAELIDQIGQSLGDFAKWPESEMTKEQVNKHIKQFRKVFKDGAYPQVFLFMAILQVAAVMYNGATWRSKIELAGLKRAWITIGDLLD